MQHFMDDVLVEIFLDQVEVEAMLNKEVPIFGSVVMVVYDPL